MAAVSGRKNNNRIGEINMGIVDLFTSETPVTLKQTTYYALVKESVKAELLENGVKAGVPNLYIQAFITGEEPKFLKGDYQVLESETTSCYDEWSEVVKIAKVILDKQRTKEKVDEAEKLIKQMLKILIKARKSEIKNIQEQAIQMEKCYMKPMQLDTEGNTRNESEEVE